MTDEQIAALDDEAAKGEAARVTGGEWKEERDREWVVLAPWGTSWRTIEWSLKEWIVWDGKPYSDPMEEGVGTIGDASRAFLRHYYAGRISLPGRPAWAPVLERLQAAGFDVAQRFGHGGPMVAVPMDEAFRIAMEGVGDE